MTDRVAKIFNGRFTIQAPNEGEHRTLSIRTQDKKANFAPGKRVVSLLVGPDNTRSYKAFGFVTDNGINVFFKMRGTNGKPSEFEWFAHMLWNLGTEGEASRFYKLGYRLLIEGRCIRCNKVLTEPESIRTGIGPICAGRDRRRAERAVVRPSNYAPVVSQRDQIRETDSEGDVYGEDEEDRDGE